MRQGSRALSLAALAALAGTVAIFVAALPAFAQRREVAAASASPLSSSVAPSASASAPSPGAPLRCVEQRPQPFLVRSNWFNNGAEGQRMFQHAIRYRTENYGYFAGFGRPDWNAHSPRHYAVTTKFMGFSIQVNRRVVPALRCVEQALMAGPAHLEYRPHGIGGIRFHNTYRGGEVSNHVYGIAIDIDSDTNTCCGCVGAWAKHPACSKHVETIFERMSMPRSWVETFERYGWYWLGHDVLQDTMHFEFLGDPEKVLAQ